MEPVRGLPFHSGTAQGLRAQRRSAQHERAEDDAPADADAVDVLQIELTQTGLTPAMAIAAAANKRGIAIVNHHYVLDVNLAASLHFLAAVDSIDLCETPGNQNPIRDAITRNPPRPDADGMIAVPTAPGLGIDIDETAVRRFTVND